MIYQKEVAFNELSAHSIKQEDNEYILKSFFELCLMMIKLSGKSINNPNKYNLQHIRFDENFIWEAYIGYPLHYYLGLIEDKIQQNRIRILLATFDLPSLPAYRFEKEKICNGLGYAQLNKVLAISLKTDKIWNNTTIQIDKISLVGEDDLTTSLENVINITTIDHAFSIVEEFADRFYENTYHQRPTFENLLPLIEISNQYLEHIDFYQTEELQIGTKREVSDKKKVAKIVAEINGWKKCSTSGRDIYKHTQCDYYLAIDTKKGDFEIHDSKGEHLGAISFDYQKAEGAVKNRKITPC